jgi:hypothetical protein
MKNYLRILIVVIATVVPLTSRYILADDDCQQGNVPIDSLPSSSVKVLAQGLSLGLFGRGWLTLRNQAQKRIKQLTIVVSYLDSDRKPIFAISYFGGTRGLTPDLEQTSPFIRVRLPHPIKPGETFSLEGTNLLSTKVMPVNSKVTDIHATFDDGTDSLDFEPAQFFTDPMLSELPKYFEMPVGPRPLPDDLLVSIAIDAHGRVTRVESVGSGTLTVGLMDKIRSQLVLWSFYPATKQGWADETHLKLWLRFHPKPMPLPQPICPLSLPDSFPVTFAEVDLMAVDENRWQVMYGGYFAHAKFESVELFTVAHANRSSHVEP